MEPTLTHSPKTWRSWVEPWYLVYALLGATAGGLSPILLPLAVGRTNTPSDVGLVMGAVNLGGLTAPVWGGLAGRSRFRRLFLMGGLLMTSLGLSAFPFTSKTTALVGLALLQGVGAAAAATVSTLFVVGVHPRAEWHARIGWLQAFYSAGGVGGLLLAGVLSHTDMHVGLPMAASLAALSIPLAWRTLRTPPLQAGGSPSFPHRAPSIECAFGSPHRYSHHLTPIAVGRLAEFMVSPYGAFLAIWLLSSAGAAAYFSVYPLLMQRVYSIDPALASWAFALAAGISLFMFPRAGKWSDRFGPAQVLRLSLVARLLAFLGLSGLALTHIPGREWLAVLVFIALVQSWPFLNVSGTTLGALCSSAGEGEGMGILNAATALANGFGAFLGGWAVGRWSYGAAPVVAVACVGSAILMTLPNRHLPVPTAKVRVLPSISERIRS